ncbi:MAG: TIGR01777 family protein [Deltaproteobacteria bacterium]|nr:TIGR01777 family protein [Deltaproteobacteria bacterium]
MRIFVTGGTGFVGTALVPFLLSSGHSVRLLVRPGERRLPGAPELEVVDGDPTHPGSWMEAVGGCDAAINLAGAPIFGRWSEQTKRLIRDSRISTTRHLVEAIPEGEHFVLLSTSAVGIYGDAGERELDEDAPLGTDFLAQVARDWEAEALRAREKGARTVIARFAIVFGPGGGALEQLTKATHRFAGGPIGGGRQWVSWIHRTDLVRALLFLAEARDREGVFNLSSPNPARQIEVARAIGRLLHRPAMLPAPAFAVRLVLGEFANAVLFSQRMIPRRLQEAGFSFRFPDLEGALLDAMVHQSA